MAGAKDFLWCVRTNDSVLYLVGSFHTLRESDASTPRFPIRSFEHAFARSQRVAFEVNPHPDDEVAVERFVLQKGLYPPGVGSIRKAIGEATYARLRNVLKADGVPSRVIDRVRPWFASVLVDDVFAERPGFDRDYGLVRR
jgi:uncharacterized protein YbaP (TraB family)